MVLFVVFLFMVFVGVVTVIYLLASSKESLWEDHVIEPRAMPEKKAQVEEGRCPEEPWNVLSIKEEFNAAKDQIHGLDGTREKPSQGESLTGFFSYSEYAIDLMWKEKEIFTFALLQWAVIGAGYYLWVQMLGWIPAEVWQSTENSNNGSVADVVLLLWSFVCVGIVAYPLGILSACMGAVHFIRRQGRSSSIAECLRIVLPKAWSLWAFTWMDGWITVNQILKRLPKKNDRTSPAEKALSEALYFAWKIGTIGILPGLITGRGLVESTRRSVDVVRHKFKEIMKLRLGYSLLCWVIGIATYVGTIYFLCTFSHLLPQRERDTAGFIYTFYLWVGIPICLSVGIIQMFLRPVYVIASCHIYSDYLNEKQEKILLPTPPSKSFSALVVFGALLIILAVVFIYRDQLGITKLLSVPYGQ